VQEERYPWACQIDHYARRTAPRGLLDRAVCCRDGAPHFQWAFAGLVVSHARVLPGVGHVSTLGRGWTP